MKPIQEHKDPRVTNNVSFDHLTDSIYIVDHCQSSESMLTSPRTNGADQFVPSHHLALITQPVLGARSRLRKKATNSLLQTAANEKSDSMTHTRRSSYNDSPPFILPISRIDPTQFQKKTHFNHQHESSDSGLDLSLSTNSSLQQQHIPIHRPLSALNEDSTSDEHQHVARLRFPPVHFGRNRSMEDMMSNNTQEPQYRSSSFSDERQQGNNLKRTSDGAIGELFDSSTTESYRRTNPSNKNDQHLHPSITQQHRSFNDLTNKTSNKIPLTTQTTMRQPNTSTLKPLRKKTKLNIIVEPTIPLTSSRLAAYDEQINMGTGTTSSSSNQTTPRSIRPQQQPPPHSQIKSKASTPLGYYANPDQLRAHVNRSVVERQHPTHYPPPQRRGLIQQMLPFDASPSKVNNLRLRHPHQPTIIFHPSSTSQLTSSRPIKHTLPTLYNEESNSHVEEEQRKPLKLKEQEERKRFKQKEEIEIQQKGQTKSKVKDHQQPIASKILQKRRNSQDLLEQTHSQRQFNNSKQQQQEKDLSVEKTIYNRQRRVHINDRHGSGRSTSTTGKSMDNNINRRQVEPVRSNGNDEEQRMQKSKPIGLALRNKTQIDKSSSRTSEYGSDYSHGKSKPPPRVVIQTRLTKSQLQTYETSIAHHSSNQWQNSKYGSDSHPWQKSQIIISQAKPTRIEPINSNVSEFRRERETSRLSNQSKTDSTLFEDKSIKQKFIPKDSTSHFQSTSPTSWSIISAHQQQFETDEKLNAYQSELSTSPSNDQFIDDSDNTSSRTYRLAMDDQQPIDGRHVIPSNNLPPPSSIDQSFHTSSRHTYPFTYTPDSEPNNDDTLVDHSSPSTENKKEEKSSPSDVYTLSDHETVLTKSIDPRNSPSPLVHISPKKKYSSPPPLPKKKITIPTDKEEILSNYDSDDGWSDDSAELLYVDERYATDKRKLTTSSHLPSQQRYYYHLQQQNVLLQ